MAYFALQVFTGDEGRFVTASRRSRNLEGVRVLWPRRRLRVRRAGRWLVATAPIFPGYLFLKREQIDGQLYQGLRPLPGFLRFLPSNDRIRPLDERDSKLLAHFLSFGEIVERSTAYFDVNQRIRIVSGPLLGLEGCITRVDKRKGRAKVRLTLYENSFEVDFGFDAIEKSADRGGQGRQGGPAEGPKKNEGHGSANRHSS